MLESQRHRDSLHLQAALTRAGPSSSPRDLRVRISRCLDVSAQGLAAKNANGEMIAVIADARKVER